MDPPCPHCAALRVERDALRAQLHEMTKLCTLQQADLDRLQKARDDDAPNTPERVPAAQLQDAFGRLVESMRDELAANDATRELVADAAAPDPPSPAPEDLDARKRPKPRGRPRGRRRLDLTTLPFRRVVLDPDEVIAAHGEGFCVIGEEVSERLVFLPGTHIRLQIARRKWARIEPSPAATLAWTEAPEEASVPPESPTVQIAPVPDNVWPRTMADPSAIAQHLVAKYEDCLPLHRQEKISARHGFCVPRGTQCGWLTEAFTYLHRITDAMFDDAKAHAFCLATDATSAPVRAPGQCVKHHVFVFVADQRHVVFRHAPAHNGVTVQTWLTGDRGYVLADAASIDDVVYRTHPIVEVACWAHLRRYFWRALGSDPQPASEAIAVIGKLFEVQRACASLPMPERTAVRADKARPLLHLFDRWIERHRDTADARGPLRAAITYYDNQRAALHRFLEDGRLRLDNNLSEAQLRRLVLGRANWTYFANETGLDWYVTFRSLIASCHLHGLNPQQYLEQVLRLAPHWPVTRMIELSPHRWKQTLATLSDAPREILKPPWELDRTVTPRPVQAVDRAA